MGSFKKFIKKMMVPNNNATTTVSLDNSVCIASKGEITVKFNILSPEEIKNSRNNAYQYIIP